MKGWSISLLLLVLRVLCCAQSADTSIFYIKAITTGSVNKTNEGQSFISNNNIRFSINRKDMILNTNNSWIYGAQTIGLTNNDFSSSVDYSVFKPEGKLFYWVLATYDKSYSLKINNRVQSGVGLGYMFFNKEPVNVSLSDGIIYERNQLYDMGDVNTEYDYETFRNSLRLKYRFAFFNNVMVLDGVHFWQQSLSRKDDYILKSYSTFSVKLKSWLSITMSLVYNKLNVTSKETLLVNYGLTFEKTF